MSTNSTSTQTSEIHTKLASLQEALLSASPNMPTILRDIHRNLKSDPALVTVLTESEVAIIVRGLKKQTSTEIATQKIKKKPKKALSKMTLDDL